ncbi:hypothetical protein [Aquisalinus flavus]|uniref:Uncharacterized protein n=1 Tax=Aquisalinus flavus TaxID=1526572 RepID=A0A8J2Y786_9PROT|nr:hypothetical protein [Aquisalinus flavus]MBD0427129.1 hypothetical protein [Aquisalinus flavus]UNE46949.1 hypothetical protein FF099_02200 [Aquisalinus flavus]GGC98592.1 hypothetical protein GCM10011342_04420 [Aquisalinus flavus]
MVDKAKNSAAIIYFQRIGAPGAWFKGSDIVVTLIDTKNWVRELKFDIDSHYRTNYPMSTMPGRKKVYVEFASTVNNDFRTPVTSFTVKAGYSYFFEIHDIKDKMELALVGPQALEPAKSLYLTRRFSGHPRRSFVGPRERGHLTRS